MSSIRNYALAAAFILTASAAAWGQAATGNGLIAEHYDTNNLTGAVAATQTNVGPIDFTWAGTATPHNSGLDIFSSRYRGRIEGPVTGNVTFELDKDDTGRLWVNGTQLVNAGGGTTVAPAFAMTAGQMYDIVIEHLETGGAARIRLRWSHAGNGNTQQVVPANLLYSPAAVPADPTVTPNAAGVNVTPATITLATATSGAQIWYTVDGSDPGFTSPVPNAGARLYTGPFTLNIYARIRARAYHTGVASGLVTSNQFSPDFPAMGSAPAAIGNIYYRHYFHGGGLGAVPDYETFIPQKAGLLPIPGVANAMQADNFGYKYTGYVNIPAGGDWTFTSASDDGSRTFIGTNLVATNAGTGAIRLQAGWHPITVDYYENGGGQSINIQWQGPTVPSATTIPNTSLGHDLVTATPVIAPAGGGFAGSQLVTLTCATAGATIYYTVDGSPPDPRTSNGSGASGLSFTITATTRVRAVAIAPGRLLGGDLADSTFTRTDVTAVNAAITSAVPMGVNNSLELNFDRTVLAPSAETIGNYALGSGTVSAAALQARNADLRAWLRLDETVSPSLDSSPLGTNTAAWTNTPVNDDVNFAAVDFSNSRSLSFQAADSDYVSIADAPSLQFGGTNGFTVACWVRPLDTTNRRLINKFDPTAPDKGWIIDINTASGGGAGAGQLRFRVDDGANSVDLGAASGITANTWHHIACRFDRQTSRIAVFRNGVRTGQSDVNVFNFGNVDTTRPILIGRLESPIGTASGNPYNGQLDDVRIYGVALSDAEIKGLFDGALEPSTRVVLTTSAMTPDVANTVTSSGIVDATGLTSTASQATFVYRTGTFTYERYTGVAGGTTYDLTRNAVFPNAPTFGTQLTVAEMDQTPNATSTVNLDNFGARMRGYFIPPANGNYIFSVSSDDNGILFLSPDADPARRRRIALMTAWSGYRDHADAEALQSGPNSATDTNNLQLVIPLVANQRYYLEAFMKEGGGGDNFAVAAKLDDGSGPILANAASIPTAQMAPYIEGLVLTSAPFPNRQLMAGTSATFTVTTTGSAPSWRWRRNGANLTDGGSVSGSTTAALSLTNVTSADDGTYDVVVTASGGAATSNAFTVTVVAPPAPTISAVTPAFGPDYGGGTVRVTGTNLLYGLTRLELDTTIATNFVWSGDGTSLLAQAPRHAVGPVNAVVRTTNQSNTLANGYTYYTVPTFAVVNPVVNPVGDSGGGTIVTINGANFVPGSTTVEFDALNFATLVNVAANGQSLTCTVPSHAAGQVNVIVTTPLGSATLTNGFRYYDDPTFLTINPPNGPDQGGPPAGFAAITITGTNFAQGYTTVQFGAATPVPATVNLVVGDSLTVTPPAGSGTVNVTVITAGGSVTSVGAYTYYPDPTLTSLSQTGGFDQGTQLITVNGSNFVSGFTQVLFGANPGTVQTVAMDGLSLTVTTPAGTGTVPITVNTPGGSATNGAVTFTYYADPTISTVINQNNTSFVNNGRTSGSNNVRITGSNFLGSPITVTIGGNPATGIVVTGGIQIDCVSPVGAAGSQPLVVTTPGGTANATWIYHDAPTIATVTPSNTGITQGAESRTINGSNYPSGLTIVTFGGAPATGVNAAGASASLTTPAHAAGAVDVVVDTPGGTATLSGGFTYTGPFFNSVSPAVGPEIGGQTVTLSGAGLSGATSVTFGANPAAITGNTANQITVTSPAGTGTVNVTVTTPSGTFTLSNAYTYTGTPTIGSVTPGQGPTGGGQNVQILGTNFASGFTVVTFNGVAATGVVVTGTTQIDLVTPAGAAGNAAVVVTTYGNQPSAAGSYTYVAPPTLGTMIPNRGPMAGGQTVAITGANFVPGFTEVLFNGNAATINTINATSMSVTTPAGAAAGAVNVVVRTFQPPGQSSSALSYTYVNQATAIDLALLMSVDNGTAGVGQNVTFTLTLNNTGAVAGSGVSVSDLLPASLTFVSATPSVGSYNAVSGIWTVGNIAATNGTATLAIVATVNSAVSIVNVAEVSAATQEDVDSVPNNGSTTEDDRASATVDAGLAIQTPAALPAGTARAYYSATIAATGGTAPYAWSLLNPAPPFPFNLDPATGEISGFAPDVAVQTVYTFDIRATDASSTPQTSTRTFTITVDPPNAGPPVVSSTPAAPNGVVGQVYGHTFTATGGAPPYTWTSTALPAGLALNPFTGELAGTPTAAGAASFSVTATPATGAASAAFPVAFTIAANPITLSPASLPNGSVGVLYAQYLEVSGGVGPFAWSTTGTLPPNVTLTAGAGRRATLSGTPGTTSTGTPNFSVQVVDNGQAAVNTSRAYTVVIAAAGGPLAITLPAGGFPVATINRPFTAQLTSTGGGASPFWALDPSSSLPPGLTLNGGSGIISGTPAGSGVFTFTVTATPFGGGAGSTVTADLTISVAPAPTLTGSLTLPAAVQNSGYFAQLTLSGGAQPITWSGTVPAGLTLNPLTGTISGVPTGTGALNFTLTATDANGAAVSGNFSLNVAPASATLAAISTSLPRGQVGVPYSGSLFATGGTRPYSWAVLGVPALPAWASLDPLTGTITGTPTGAGSTTHVFRVTDNVAATADSAAISLDIDGLLTITTTSLPLAGVSSPYGAGLSATGGTGTLVWSLVSGSLPGGLSLSPAGSIGGTCSATAVTSTFQVRVTDSQGRTANRSFTITVGPQIFPPSGGSGGGGGGCGGSIGLGSIPLGALASLAALLALAARRRK